MLAEGEDGEEEASRGRHVWENCCGASEHVAMATVQLEKAYRGQCDKSLNQTDGIDDLIATCRGPRPAAHDHDHDHDGSGSGVYPSGVLCGDKVG